MGTTSHGECGAVGIMGHRSGSRAHSFVKLHRIQQCKVTIFGDEFSKLSVSCDEVFSKWAQPHMVWMVSLEPWDTVGVHPRIYFQNAQYTIM